jgi:uncharacterized protein YjaG (DUF416 family)
MAVKFEIFLNELLNDLASLTTNRQLAFATACCEYHFPEYLVFVEQEGWGDIAILRGTLDVAWKVVRGNRLETTGLMELCERAIPDSEDFSSDATSTALNAAAMVTHLANFLETQKTEDVWWIASLGRDTADCRSVEGLPASTLITPEIEAAIETSESMRAELDAQQLFLMLASATIFDPDQLLLQARQKRQA